MDRPEDIVEFFGQKMRRDYAVELQAAQEETHYRWAGASYKRIPFGHETHMAKKYFQSGICRHCNTILGKLHTPECDYEQCPICGSGSMSCDCQYEGYDRGEEPQIVHDPNPFTPAEREIVEARRAYSWRWLGTDDDGNYLFEVHNGSRMTLPFYSVGIRDKKEDFIGAVWLPVSDVKPGSTAVIKHEGYKEYIERENIEAFALPDPEPDDRDSYWEFK
jgi:hypothetical protein